MSKNPPGLILENLDEVKAESQRCFALRFPYDRGFSRFPRKQKPHFRYSRKEGRKPLDVEIMGGYWLISDRAKEVFDAVDPTAFDYMPCDISYAGEPSPQSAWVCDVVRILDAVDEEKSEIEILGSPSNKVYDLSSHRARMVFKEDVVGNAHIFLQRHMTRYAICDNVIRDACKAAKLKSISFMPTYLKSAVARAAAPAGE